jgi:serine phosphatase RsbU (regulator of sigma subunit)
MNTKKEKLLNDTYYKWIQTTLYDLPLDGFNDFVDPEIMGYGTAIDEKVLSISDYREMVNRQREQAVGLEMSFESTPVFRSISNKEDSAIFVDEIKVLIILKEGKQELFLRLTTILEYINSKWIVVHLHGSMPTETTAETDTWLANEWQRKNEQLQKLVDEKTSELLNKNRELEIETALEKVRSSALAMKEPADMVEVCHIISDQLELLGVKDIRNVQTAIINEQKGTYLNYQYFAAYKKEAIEETDYNKHPTSFAMVQEMKKSANSTFNGSMEGNELITFREWRKQNNQFPDPLLDEADSVHYYFYSIGLGGLGLSTYNPLNDDELEIFKRFHKVFTLAYLRFIDIEKALAQAREAQIEAALERVRSRTIGMQRSDELQDASVLLFQQVEALGLPVFGCGFNIWDDDRKAATAWMAGKDRLQPPFKTSSSEDIFLRIFEAAQRGESIFVEEQRSEALKSHYKYMNSIPVFKKIADNMVKTGQSFPAFQIMHCAYFPHGYLMFISFEPVSNAYDIFKRFAKVFEQTYTRFLDLQKAEAQAREAQIEAALERVRARSMGMHKTEELVEVVRLLDKEIIGLGVEVNGSQIVTNFANPEDGLNDWFAKEGQDYLEKFHIPYLEHPLTKRMYNALHKGVDFYTENYSKAEKNKYFRLLFKYSDFRKTPKERHEFVYDSPAWVRAVVVSKNSILIFQRYDFKDFIKEEEGIFKRFGKVFEQAYTRFLDLQKAEAQAREAQIEAALEKVRSRSLAMQKADELGEVVTVVVEKLRELEIPVEDGVAIVTFVEGSKDLIEWMENPGFSVAIKFLLPYFDHPVLADFWKAKNDGLDFVAPRYTAEENQSFLEHIFENTDFKHTPEDIQDYCLAADTYSYSASFRKNSCIFINDYSVRNLTEEEIDIVKRFSKVFEQAYTRFLDLQKSEEQRKIIQAENERKTKELEEARKLQLAMLPKTLPKMNEFDFAVYMKTATEVGGDYYDFIQKSDGSFSVAIGDATGHGMRAGIMVAIMKTLFVSDNSELDIIDFFSLSNKTIRTLNLGRMLMAFAMLNITRNKIKFVSAGMPPFYIYRARLNLVEEIMTNGMPFGAINDFPYESREIEISSGDTLLLLSDGFPELQNDQNEQYGYSKLKETFKSVANTDPETIIAFLKDESNRWSTKTEPDDDITFVVIKVK